MNPRPSARRSAPQRPHPFASYKVTTIGAPRMLIRDFYHWYLRQPWWAAIAVIVVGYLLLNLGFAFAFALLGGVVNAQPGSLRDGFYFSIQTMGTIGYGAMYPVSTAANVLVVCESVVGLLTTAVATGLVFAKFARPTARLKFSKVATVAPMDGVPTLMFRLGNERGNYIVDALIRVVMTRTEITKEGMTFYRMWDLPLVRERSPALNRSWTVMHQITPQSPLYGESPESLARTEAEFGISMSGIDDTTLQQMNARQTYEHHQIVWGARHADILSEDGDGGLVLDLRKFHEITKTAPISGFPYPASAVQSEPR